MEKKKNILFITPSLQQGGVEHSLITLLKLIDPSEYNIDLYLYVDKLDLLYEVPEFINVIIGIDTTKYYRKIHAIILLIGLYFSKLFSLDNIQRLFQKQLNIYIRNEKVLYPKNKYFKDKKYDTVISFCLHIGSEMALKIQSEKYYLFLHMSKINYHKDTFEKVSSKYDRIIAVSPGVEGVYVNAYPQIANKIMTIANYVNEEEVIKKSQDKSFNFVDTSKEWIICSCGRLTAEKGFDLAIEAAKKLKDKHISFVWYFLGDGIQKVNLEKKINENNLRNEVIITGLMNNPFPIMAKCNIYVQPSYEEAYGRTIKEALILRKLIVSTDTIGAKCVLDNGKYGVLTPISSDGIFKGILTLMHDTQLQNSYLQAMSNINYLREKGTYISKVNALLNGDI